MAVTQSGITLQKNRPEDAESAPSDRLEKSEATCPYILGLS